MDDVKLEPCPHCGEQLARAKEYGSAILWQHSFSDCINRDLLLAPKDIPKWNRRAPDARTEALVEALEPFAAVADIYSENEDDTVGVWIDASEPEIKALTIGACRKARAALSGTGSGGA